MPPLQFHEDPFLLKFILDEVGVYVYVKDLEGRYTYVNKSVADLFNTTPDQIIGKKDNDFFDLSLSNQLREVDKQVTDSLETIQTEEVNYVKETGEKKVYLSIKKPLFDRHNKLIGLYGISTDISERKKIEEKAQREHLMLETVLNNVDAFIYMKDENYRFQYVNKKVADLFGLPADQIIGRPNEEIMTPEFAAEVTRLDQEVFDKGVVSSGRESFPDLKGNTRHYWTVKLPIQLDEQQRMLIGFSSDITELHQLQKQLKQQALTDDLTGLANRRAIFDEMDKTLARAERRQSPTSIILLDLDFFKRVNDTYGHPIGDEVLKHCAQLILTSIRSGDTAARLGGEEFGVLLPDTSLPAAKLVADRIHTIIETTPYRAKDLEIFYTASIGLYCHDQGRADTSHFYSKADELLYRAKNSGRNKIVAPAKSIFAL